ncbi:MAG: NAD-dependent epimerase/dehydratase family protein [Balneolales bacterium]|nr:NAD-dependent epimerase/dehydratase family protein [Balneolales bacterium]
MIAFVTGGTGFVGSHLAEALINSTDYKEVRCLVRSSDKWLTEMQFERIKGDLNNFQIISDALTGVDTIFHVAGVVRAPSKKEFTQANVDATENLLMLAQKKNVKNVVILSSLAAAGPSFGTPLTEKDQGTPVSMYGESKLEMEQMIRRVAKKECSVKILRPPAVYGPREADIYAFFKTFNLGICPIVGDGNHPRLSMVYVKDLIDGIMLASQKTDPGIFTYFLGGDEDSYSWNQIREITSIVLNKKAVPIKIKPQWITRIGAVVEAGASVFGSYPVVNREKTKEMTHEWVCSSDLAKKELGYAPSMPINEGISRTIRWYKQHNWL